MRLFAVLNFFSKTKIQVLVITIMKSPVKLRAGLSSISIRQIPIKAGEDGLDYCILEYQTRIAYFSRHTEYSLCRICRSGVRLSSSGRKATVLLLTDVGTEALDVLEIVPLGNGGRGPV